MTDKPRKKKLADSNPNSKSAVRGWLTISYMDKGWLRTQACTGTNTCFEVAVQLVSVPSLINLALELATELRRHGRLLRKGLQAVTILMAIRLHSISFPEAKSQILHGKG
jgi:hypothetical protein